MKLFLKFPKFLKRFYTKKYIISALILFVILGIVLKFTVFSSKEKVDTAVVKRGELVKELTLSGKIDADEQVALQFQMGGLLTYAGVKEGDKVEKYQTIAALDERTAQKNLEQALIDYSKQRITFDTTVENNQNRTPQQALNDTMKRLLQNNQYDLDKTILSVELKDLARQLSFLSTPISGIVTRIDVPGTGVNIYLPSQAQFEITNPDSIFFNITADQTEVIYLKEGMTANIILDSFPDKKIRSKIKTISFTPKTGESETVYEIKAELLNIDNLDYQYKIGMTGDITFKTDRKKNVLFLPSKFIKSDSKGVYVVLKNKKKQYIKTDFETDSFTEVNKELKEGTVVYDQID